MKIGIITIHSVYNYGAVFQAFALKEYIKSIIGKNDTVNVIDYRPVHFESKKSIRFTKDITSNLIELERLALHSKFNHRDNAFEKFIIENDSLSEPCKTKEELSILAKEYDVLISGSDQVWNFNITGGDRSYLLDISGYAGTKLAYSSSLGNFRFYKEQEDKIKQVFDDFSALACREADGCEYLEKLTGKSCQLTCDPTLLLNADAYSSHIENKLRNKIKKLAEKKFLLIYNLSTSKEVLTLQGKLQTAEI